MNTPPPRKIACVARRAPHGSVYPAEALDLALVAATCEQDVTMAFLDDGVYQLVAGQRPAQAFGIRDFSAAFRALPQYGCDKVLVERASLERRGLRPEQLLMDVTVMETAALLRVLAQQDVVIDS